MKTVISLVLLLSLSPTIPAQETTENVSSPFKVGITASADFCSYLWYEDGILQSEGLAFGESPSIGWSAGIHAAYEMNTHWSLIAGLRYTEHNVVYGPQTLIDQTGNSFGTAKFTYHTRYVDSPIGIQLNTSSDERLMFIGNFCITPGYALGEWTELDYEGENIYGIQDSQDRSEPDNFNYFSLKAELYAGMGINFGAVQLQFLPQFRMNLFKATRGSYINRQYWTAGTEIRCVYEF